MSGQISPRQKTKISYRAIHYRLEKDKPKPELCQRCKEEPATDLSFNGPDKGYSKDPNDYEWLCKSCHNFKDRTNGVIMTKAQIRKIREFYIAGITGRELAVLFKVTCATISNIVNYKGHYQKLINPSIFKMLVQDLNSIDQNLPA